MTVARLLQVPGQPLATVEVGLEPPRRGEVAVQVGATGVCRSRIAVYNGTLPNSMPTTAPQKKAPEPWWCSDDPGRVR